MRSRRRGPGIDAYLFPAIVGGGRGDVDEVLSLGRHLRAAGVPAKIWRDPGHPWPARVEEYLAGSRAVRRTRWEPRAVRALTVSPSWGITAGPETPGPLGRPGPWAVEARRVEEAYGVSNVLHVSIEEFGRTLTSREQTIERYREAGRPLREIRRRVGGRRGRAEVREFRDAYRRFRALGTANVLHLYASFRPSRVFQREFPEAVQTGPLSPTWTLPRPVSGARARATEWLWYASPGSSGRLAAALERGLNAADARVRIAVRLARPAESLPATSGHLRSIPMMPDAAWQRRFLVAPVRIVTGSRTLIEAVASGRPFLYFNGVIGRGSSTRVHRPEKLRSLLELWKSRRVNQQYRKDLADFARLRDTDYILRRAALDPDWRRRFPRVPLSSGFAPEFDRLEKVVLRAGRQLAAGQSPSEAIVRELRTRGRSLLA